MPTDTAPAPRQDRPTPWKQLLADKKVLAWAFYDWGNSAYATTIMAGFFPIFFKQYWSVGTSAVESTAKLGYANSMASFILAILSPLLGALADRSRGRKKLLLFFTFIGAISASSLYFVEKQEWVWAAVLYVFSSIGFFGGQSFYDALLPSVAKPRDMDQVSGLGYGLGYLGGGVLFAVNVAMTLKPSFFGLEDAAQAVRVSFFMVGVWWLCFTVPLMWQVEEPPATGERVGLLRLTRDSFRELIATFKSLRQLRTAFLFLIAYFFYIDGVNTIIKMAVDYGMALGFKTDSLISALLLVQFIGFPAAIGFSVLANKFGSKKALNIAIITYAVVTVAATGLQVEWHFYALACAIGLVQGGIQALSRSVFGQLIPAEKSGEFYGFFNMLGRFSSVLGPLLIAVSALISESPRVAMLSLLLLFGTGFFILQKVDFPEEMHGRRE
ncbi:MFS transporter [soil metagenome]